VISLKTLPFLVRHYAELANVPSLALFLVNCTNTVLPSRILPLAMFTFHTLPEDVSAYHPKVTQGGPREASMGCLCLILFVQSESHL
jgi:hypothetical protein